MRSCPDLASIVHCSLLSLASPGLFLPRVENDVVSCCINIISAIKIHYSKMKFRKYSPLGSSNTTTPTPSPKPVFDRQEALLLPKGTEEGLSEMVTSLKRMTTDEGYRKEVGERIS